MTFSKETLLKNQHFILLVLLIFVAFLRNIESVKDLHYGYDIDSDRDLGNVQNVLEGNAGADPSYIGEYQWYNPLITYIQVALIKLTGLSAVQLTTQAGAFLNIFAPLMFYLMVSILFNSRISIAATASFLFFNTGDMQGCQAATYSPWLYPGNFMQILFYLGIIVLSKAFMKPGYFSFIIAGFVTGIVFLGHTAPAAILLFIAALLFFKQFKLNSKSGRVDFLKYGFIYGITFFLVSLPLLYIIVGKYKLHMINIAPSMWMIDIFWVGNFFQLLKENLSIFFVIACAGFLRFLFCKYETNVKHNVVFAWLFSCSFLFFYTSVVPIFRYSFNINLPPIVPSFHFFFYLKALQSVLFGIGLCWLMDITLKKVFKTKLYGSGSVTILIMIITLAYYPIYSHRRDFKEPRETGLKRNSMIDEIDIYHLLLNKTNINDVVVCDEDWVAFPVMAAGRKLQAATSTVSNPYLDFIERDKDRKYIIKTVQTGNPEETKGLLNKYKVKFILLENAKIINPDSVVNCFGKAIYKNKKFSIYLNKQD